MSVKQQSLLLRTASSGAFSTTTRQCVRLALRVCRRHLLLSMTILSVVLGLIAGFSLRGSHLGQETVGLINFPGEIFMQVLKLMILPLIFSSLTAALAQMDARESGQMGILTVGYYLLTTLLATFTGIVLVLAIHPGDPTIYNNDLEYQPVEHSSISALDTFLDVIRNMFPRNVVQAAFQRVQTRYYSKKSVKIKMEKPPVQHQFSVSAAAAGASGPLYHLQYNPQHQSVQTLNASGGAQPKYKVIENVPGMNILGIIVFCTGFGIVISKLGEKAKIVVEFFVILETVIMRLVEALMWFAPIGIVSLIAGNVLELEDLSDAAAMLFLYVVTVLAGLAIHTFFTTPLLYFFLTRKNPVRVARGMIQALVTAFGTASGGAALPVSMHCMETKLNVDRRVTRFVLPLGSTINMDGNALYEAVAVIFIAQLNNVTLTITEVVTISFIATIASLGLNSVPAGLVSILGVLSVVGLPTKDVSLIITADWLIDRVRTSANVLGDAYAASNVAHLLGEKLEHNRKNSGDIRLGEDALADDEEGFEERCYAGGRTDDDECDSIGSFVYSPQSLISSSTLLPTANEARRMGYTTMDSTPPLNGHKSSSNAGGLTRRISVFSGSRRGSCAPEHNPVYTWREQAILERLYANIALNKVQHV